MPHEDLLYSAQQLSPSHKSQLKELVKAVARGTYQPTLLPASADPTLLNTLKRFTALKKESRQNYYLKLAFILVGRQVEIRPFLALTRDSQVQAVDFRSLDTALLKPLPAYQKPKGTVLELNLAYIVASDEVRDSLARTLERIASKLAGDVPELRQPQISSPAPVQFRPAPPPSLTVSSSPPTTVLKQLPAVSLEPEISRPAQQLVSVQKTLRKPLEAADFALALAAAFSLLLLFRSVVGGLFGAAIALSISWIRNQQTVMVKEEQPLGRDDIILNSLADYEQELIAIIRQHSASSEVGRAAATQLGQVRQAARELGNQHDSEQAQRTVGEIGHYLRQIRKNG